MDTVYVHIRHWLFWYGQYGFCGRSCNDEITIYLDMNKDVRIGYFEIKTKDYLKYCLDNDIDENEDEEYYNEVKSFLESSDKTYYSYIYPNPLRDEDILDQVTHFAPTNEKGHKPVYIQMWTKLFESWDVDTIKQCVKFLDKEFLHKDINNIEILDMPTYEETKSSYEEDLAFGISYE